MIQWCCPAYGFVPSRSTDPTRKKPWSRYPVGWLSESPPVLQPPRGELPEQIRTCQHSKKGRNRWDYTGSGISVDFSFVSISRIVSSFALVDGPAGTALHPDAFDVDSGNVPISRAIFIVSSLS